MKWSFATVGVILLALFGISIIMLFQTVTTSSENDYYLLKEVTEAAMIDAIDIPYYRETGDLKIIKEKFVENFIRRYAESTILVSGEYTIKFYEIMETPPKASVIIDTNVGSFSVVGNVNNYNVQNYLDAILEYTGKNTFVTSENVYYDNPYTSKTFSKDYYVMTTDGTGYVHSLKLPSELIAPNIKDVKIQSVSYGGKVTTQGELNEALMRRELSFYNKDDGSSLNNTTNYFQSIDEYETNVSGINLEFYNCSSSTPGTTIYNCNDTNRFFVSGQLNVSGSTSKDKTIARYKVVWSYKEYEFSN